MRTIRILFLLLALLDMAEAMAQPGMDFPTVDAQSLALFQKGDWKGLAGYGRQALAAGVDYLNLRLRLGYAAFASGDYATAIVHYEKALGFDSYNETARYHIHYARRYLGQHEIATAEAERLPSELLRREGLLTPGVTLIGAEFSYKSSLVDIRNNPAYGHLTLGHRVSPRLHLQHAITNYSQRISEPLLTGLANNTNIIIGQTGFWNRAAFNIDRRWQAVAAYQYQNSAFGSLVYHHHVLMLGGKYYGSRVALQGDVVLARMLDTGLVQAELTLHAYPLGNQNLYGLTTLTARNASGSPFLVRQVLGAKVSKGAWLEAYATIGSFRNYAEADGLYLYNAIDTDRFKAGASAYIQLPRSILLQLGYTFENRQLYGRTTTFFQHSFTGGITWRH